MARRKINSSRIIVTGASSGIGFELVKLLLERDCRVIATARRQEKLDQLIPHVTGNSELVTIAGDVTDQKLRLSLVEAASENWGGLDVLVNNAGVGALGKFEDSNAEALRRVMEVNFFAPVELMRESFSTLQHGVNPLVVNISSVLGHRAVPEKSEYCASKFALHGFSDAVRAEWAGQVDVLLVSPSTIQSEFFDHAVENHSDRDWTPQKAMSPGLVARKTLQAMQAGKHEVILSLGGKSLVLFDRLMPTLTNKLVQRFG